MALTSRISSGQKDADFVHDLNNPLGSVHANLSQMAEYLEDLRSVWERVQAVRAARENPEALRLAAGSLVDSMEAVNADFLLEDMRAAVHESLAGASSIRRIIRGYQRGRQPGDG